MGSLWLIFASHIPLGPQVSVVSPTTWIVSGSTGAYVATEPQPFIGLSIEQLTRVGGGPQSITAADSK